VREHYPTRNGSTILEANGRKDVRLHSEQLKERVLEPLRI
jgi:hypothetical protein